MAEKITYILGAGASIGAFPLVKGTPQWDDKGLADKLIDAGEELQISFTSTNLALEIKNTAGKISSSLKATGRNSKEFGNVDSYAKYLYHTKKTDQLKDLKIALTYFFIRKQICNGFIKENKEKRYLNFITSLINEEHKFPEHVKILNWNYDYLLEGANFFYEKEMFSCEGIADKQSDFINYFPNIWPISHLRDKLTLVHLNGIAGFYSDRANGNHFKSIFHDILPPLYRTIEESDLIKLFHEKYINNSHLITFAWEKDYETKAPLLNSAEIAKEIIKGTTTLVIIGYSFPFYNREIDNMIFETIASKDSLTLKKIYFQDPFLDGSFLVNRYKLPAVGQKAAYKIGTASIDYDIPGVEIEHIPNTDQFYIPVEL